MLKMFDHLPKNQRATALACWEGFGDWDHATVAGVHYAAWAYAHSLLFRKAAMPSARMKPHLIEKELGRVAADARALLSKLGNLSPFSLELICIQLQEDSGLWKAGGMMVHELESLAGNVEVIAKAVADRKQPPNGRRQGVSGRVPPVEHLLFDIGRMVSFRKGKVTHILPIARVVHEWATGEVPGPEWGERPFEQVRPKLDVLNWDAYGDVQRTPAPAPPYDPEAGKRRLEKFKASLRAQLEATVK